MFALAGGRVTNFTAGQGLILMKEVLYVIAGKRLPVVFHVGARALTSQALNIHAGHDDVMGVADTGWGILFARNAQEAADLTAIARRVAEATEMPFFVAQDGFLTTHTLENVLLPEDELLREFVGDPRERIRSTVRPDRGADDRRRPEPGQLHERPHRPTRVLRSPAPASLPRRWRNGPRLTGRRYGRIDAYRTDDADEILVVDGHDRRYGRRPSSITSASRVDRSAASAVTASGRSPPRSSGRALQERAHAWR